MSGNTAKLSYAKAAIAPAPPVKEVEDFFNLPSDQPSPSTSVTIVPGDMGKDYGIPDAVALSPAARKDLICGSQADVYIATEVGNEDEPVQLDCPRVPVKLHCALSPVIKQQIKALPEQVIINRIVLPYSAKEAYFLIIEWFDLILKTGGHPGGLPPLTPTSGLPLFKYYHLLDVAQKLAVTPLVNNVGARCKTLMSYEAGKNFKIDPTDVEKVYEEGLTVEHPLRQGLLDAVAQAWKDNNLWETKARAFEVMWCENEAFRSDMEARGCTW